MKSSPSAVFSRRFSFAVVVVVVVVQVHVCCGSCNVSQRVDQRAVCVNETVMDDNISSAETIYCISEVCSVKASLVTPNCSDNALSSLSETQSSCSNALAPMDIAAGEPPTDLRATANTSLSTFDYLQHFFEDRAAGCTVTIDAFQRVRSCFDRTSCRTSPQSICSPVCLAQTLTCLFTYACVRADYISFASLGVDASYVARLVPLDALFCAVASNDFNRSLWVESALNLLSGGDVVSGGSVSIFSEYYMMAAVALAGVLLIVSLAIVIRRWWIRRALKTDSQHDKQRYNEEADIALPGMVGGENHHHQRVPPHRRCAASQFSSEEGADEYRMSFPQEDDWFDPPTVVDRRHSAVSQLHAEGRLQGPMQRRYGSLPERRRSSGGWVEPAPRQAVDDDEEENGTLYRPASQYVDKKIPTHQSGRSWAGDRGDMLFLDEDEDLLVSRHQDDSTGSHQRCSTDTDGLARIKMPVYASTDRRPTHSQASLAELEFAFTDPSRTNGSTSQHNDDVMPMVESEGDDDDGSNNSDAGRGHLFTPMSDSDERLVFDQESLRSSTMSNSQCREEAVVAAGLIMPRRDILHAILQGGFVRGRLLGRGTNGAVYQMNLAASTNASTVSVAMKEIDVQRCSRDELSKIIARYNFLSRLSHRYLAELYIVRYEPSTLSLNIWMEFLGGGTLTQLAKAHKVFSDPANSVFAPSDASLDPNAPATATNPHRPPQNGRQQSSRSSHSGLGSAVVHLSPFPEAELVRLVPQLLSALSYLHRKGVIHRDIKGSNILLSADRRSAKIVDLDVCFIPALSGSFSKNRNTSPPPLSSLEHTPHSVAGSPLWMPPEILASKSGPAPSTDVWSLGITVAEVLMGGALPWPSFDTTFSAMVYITQPNHRPILRRADVSEQCLNFLRQCWNPSSEHRPSAMELRSHQWLQLSRPSSFRRIPNEALSATPKSTTNTNASARSYESSLAWEDPCEAGVTLVERQASLKKRFDETAMEEEMKRLDDELSLF